MFFLILLKLLIFWSIIVFFAWQIIRLALKHESRELLISLSFVAGPIFYIFSLNVLGHFFPITFLFFFVLAAFLVIGLVLFIFNRRLNEKSFWLLDKKWRKILLITLVIIFVTTGLIAARGLSGDEINIMSSLPISATIAGGNFPVRWTVNPHSLAPYHYGLELFVAAMLNTAGLPIWFGFDLLRAVFGTLLLAFFFQIAMKVAKHPAKAYLISLLTFFGSGFIFIHGLKVFSNIYQKFFLHTEVPHFWKFLHEGTTSGVAGPLIKDIQIPWGAAAFLLIFCGVYLYFKTIAYQQQQKNWLPVLAVNIIFLSTLAIIGGEPFLLIELTVFLLYPFLALLIKSQKKYFKFYLLISFLLVTGVMLIASVQGGVLTEYRNQSYGRGLRLSDHPFLFDHDRAGYLWSPNIIINFGFPLLLILPAVYYFYIRTRKEHYYTEILQLILISLACFASPFLFDVGAKYNYELTRFFYLAPPIWSMAIGIVLAEILIDNKKTKKVWPYLVWLMVIIMMTVGVLFQLIFMVVPLGRSGERLTPFFFSYPKPNIIEGQSYDWLLGNTTINDHILTYSLDDDYSANNKKLNIFAHRFAPRYSYLGDTGFIFLSDNQESKYLSSAFSKIEELCRPEHLQSLGYQYLYVNQFWPAELESKCLENNNLELKFKASSEDEFARIYKINY